MGNIGTGERISFYQLFAEKKYRIEIPIIQRDYAQGRDSKKEVRDNFLDALYTYLEEDLPNRDLDFVYGSINTTDNTSFFIPLDGQQRLTTLFLLHWYLGVLSGNVEMLRNDLALEIEIDGKKIYRSKFTYETRPSSKEFCDALISNDINLDSLLPADNNKNNSLSKTIQNCGWFYLSWSSDPTIQSMLTMLDAIHSKFAGKKEFFARLIDKQNPRITFLFLNLKDFQLTDDLYIKMNARGMPLTYFENFKAKFEQHIGQLSWSNDAKRLLQYPVENTIENHEKLVFPKDYFSHKIDTSWADLFWVYRNINSKDNSFDDELMNFIRVIVASEYASQYGYDQNLEFLIGTQVARKKKGYTDNLTYNIYNHLGILNNPTITSLIESFDCLENGCQLIRKHLNSSFYFNEENIFIKVLRHDLLLPQRVQFYAYLKYLISNKDKKGDIYQWMRVVHNLTENSRIDGAPEVSAAIKSIDKLIPYSTDILNYLRIATNQIDFFLGRQVQEEMIKAHLIEKSSEWKAIIEKAEQQTYFRGQIAFILEFSGILSFYEEHANCNWDDNSDIKYFESFSKYANSSIVTFNTIDNNQKNDSASIDYLFERAVLSKGDYLIWASAWRRNLLSSTTNFRDFSWNRLLRLPPIGANKEEVQEWRSKRYFVKSVFDDANFDSNSLVSSLKEICKVRTNDWREHLIKNHELIRYCEQGFIRFESPHKIILYKQSQQNHRQRELYTYSLYLKYLRDIKDYSPFLNSEHIEVRNGEDYSYAILNNLCINRINYSLKIYYLGIRESFPHHYQLRFEKSKGNLAFEDYPDDIKQTLNTNGFIWYDDKDWLGFWVTKENEEETINTLKNLCNSLNNL